MSKDKDISYLGSFVPEQQKRGTTGSSGTKNDALTELESRLAEISEQLVKQNRDNLDSLYNIGMDNLDDEFKGLLKKTDDAIASIEAEIDGSGAKITALTQLLTPDQQGGYTLNSAKFVEEVNADTSSVLISASKIGYGTGSSTLADFYEEVADDYATISMIASVQDATTGEVTAASIIGKVNETGSAIMLNADHINLTGTTKLTGKSGSYSSTEISGDDISLIYDEESEPPGEWDLHTSLSEILFKIRYYNDIRQKYDHGDLAKIYSQFTWGTSGRPNTFDLVMDVLPFQREGFAKMMTTLKMNVNGFIYIRPGVDNSDPSQATSGKTACLIVGASNTHSAISDYISVGGETNAYAFCSDGIYYNGSLILST